MKKFFLTLAFVFATAMPLLAQSSMTDQQVIEFILDENSKGTSQTDILKKLMQRGVDMQQIQRVRRKYERQNNDTGLGTVKEGTAGTSSDRLRKQNGQTKKTDEKNRTKDESVSANSTQRLGGRINRNIDETDQDFLMMQSEMGGLLPMDSIEMLNRLLEQQKKEKTKIFGHDIFNNEYLSFEPNMNIATPSNYRLGPGDAVIVDIYGASQSTINATVSPDGEITIEGFGPIQVSGLTVDQANARLRSQMGGRYSSSNIKLTVGQTRSIMVNVMGEVTAPGTYTLSAFSTVFNALYMAGGVTDIGTLRNIQVFRDNRLISTVDVYDYILNGKATGNVVLTDNDVIIVGSYDCLVNINGRIKRPMYYEMKQGESLSSLLKYSGGFTGDAYRKSVRVVRKAGSLYSVHTVGEFDLGSFHMADGDSVMVDSIIKRYSNMVEVKGAVFRPGMYELGGNINSVKTLLEASEGVTEEAFTARGVMHRMKPNRTLEVLSVDIAGIMDGTQPDVPLRNEDVLFIPSKKELQSEQTITIHGEVQYPGIYQYADNETIEDFILQAGGLRDAASMVKVDVARRIIDPNATTSQDTIAQTFCFSLKDGFIIDSSEDFHLMPYDEVYVRKSPGYSHQQNVIVEGEVLFEGTYTLTKKTERLSEIIKQAGGLTQTAYAKGARLIRQRTPEERMREENMIQASLKQKNSSMTNVREMNTVASRDIMKNLIYVDSLELAKLDEITTYSVGIELDKALEKPGSDADIVLREGDRIIVPEYTNTVKINGEVLYPNTVNFVEGKGLDYYINQAGGYSQSAKKRNTYIIYMNGTVAKANRKHKPMPGCEIVVPLKIRGNKMSAAEIISLGTGTASIATMLVTFSNLLK